MAKQSNRLTVVLDDDLMKLTFKYGIGTIYRNSYLYNEFVVQTKSKLRPTQTVWVTFANAEDISAATKKTKPILLAKRKCSCMEEIASDGKAEEPTDGEVQAVKSVETVVDDEEVVEYYIPLPGVVAKNAGKWFFSVEIREIPDMDYPDNFTPIAQIATSEITSFMVNNSLAGQRKGGGTPTDLDIVSLYKTVTNSAEVMSQHAPYIGENGHWYVFDSKTLQYVDSGKESMGAQGKPGDKGEMGTIFYRVISPQYAKFEDRDEIPIGIINIPEGVREPKVDDYIISFRNGYIGQIRSVREEKQENVSYNYYELGSVFTLKGADAGYYAEANVTYKNDTQCISAEIPEFVSGTNPQLVLKVNGTLSAKYTRIDINDIDTEVFYKGSPDLCSYISDGDICTFVFDGEYWQLISVDKKAVEGGGQLYEHHLWGKAATTNEIMTITVRNSSIEPMVNKEGILAGIATLLHDNFIPPNYFVNANGMFRGTKVVGIACGSDKASVSFLQEDGTERNYALVALITFYEWTETIIPL